MSVVLRMGVRVLVGQLSARYIAMRRRSLPKQEGDDASSPAMRTTTMTYFNWGNDTVTSGDLLGETKEGGEL
jgi:hypothetical protein